MKKFLMICAVLGLSACAAQSSQNVYKEGDVGRVTKVVYGRIISMRTVEIQPEKTGAGTLAGTLAGGAAGSAVGQDAGNAIATVGGALLGAVIGATAEREMSKHEGIEYTIAQNDGNIITIAQNVAKDDVPLHVGQRVIVQNKPDKDVDYFRVLPADGLPDEVKRPKKTEVID